MSNVFDGLFMLMFTVPLCVLLFWFGLFAFCDSVIAGYAIMGMAVISALVSIWASVQLMIDKY